LSPGACNAIGQLAFGFQVDDQSTAIFALDAQAPNVH
jgi:hypothetical protein